MEAGQTNQYNTTMKNKTVIAFIVMLMGSWLSGYYGPWWAPAVFIVISTAVLGLTTKNAILIGGFALGLTFLAMSIWMSSLDQSHLIEKTGTLLGGLSPVAMIVLTSILGFVTGLLSGWLGSALGGVLKKESLSDKDNEH